MVLGFLMGCISVITNTIVLILVAIFLALCTKRKSTFAYDRYGALHFNRSPPYLVYKVLHNKLGLALAGAVGSATNTILSWEESSSYFQMSIKVISKLCFVVLSANSIAELLISVV